MSSVTNYTPPATFGRFKLQHQIGAGVLGPVFRTEDPDNWGVVAVKAFVLDITPERAHDLAAEFQHIVDFNLRQPHIAHALAAGVEGSVAYLAQQYVDAESLDVAVRQYGPAPFPDAVRLISHIAEALDDAARAGIHHGSLHPRDVLVTPGETHVTGIGVAWALERIAWRTPVRRPYAAPEREMIGAWGAPSDVYALAAIAYEVLTGRRPMSGTDDPLPGLNDLRAADQLALREALERGLDRDPDRRPATARDLVTSIAVGLLGAGASASDAALDGTAAKGQRRVRTKEPRLPGLEDPLTARPVEPAPEGPAVRPAPADAIEMEKKTTGAPVREDHPEPPLVHLENAPQESAAGVTPVDFSSLSLSDSSPGAEQAVEPDFSSLERDLNRPPAAEHSTTRSKAIDDLRFPSSLVDVPPVPRALDPATQAEPPLHHPDQPERRAGWGPFAMAAVLLVGIAIGLVAGYELGIRRTASSASALPAAAQTAAPVPAPAAAAGAAPAGISTPGALRYPCSHRGRPRLPQPRPRALRRLLRIGPPRHPRAGKLRPAGRHLLRRLARFRRTRWTNLPWSLVRARP